MIHERVTILGATGSIGTSTLDVLARHPDRFECFALTANANVAGLFEQCVATRPRYAVLVDEGAALALSARCKAAGLPTEVLAGTAALAFVAAHDDCHTVMAAIVGAAGLLPTLAAARAGKRVLLANKEALVLSGQIFMDAVAEGGATLLPIDSEHNAILQCLPPGFGQRRTGAGERAEGVGAFGGCPGVARILLTASGGPFRTRTLQELADVTPEEAVAHPNWVMGRKISVDSATMMNKGLELIEACWLFHTGEENVEVVIHPQSVIHSLVQYVDGSTLAQLGNPDMRTPIAHALGFPERIEAGVARLSLPQIARLDFEEPDLVRFPALRLARECLRAGGTTSAILNAANEVAVEAFLGRSLSFLGIAGVLEETLAAVPTHAPTSLEVILADDAEARRFAAKYISGSRT
jgi:1-deoxy-D-xylulose-5-phosphate reductoisomerase